MYTIYTEQTVSEKGVVTHFLTNLSMGKIVPTKDNEAPTVTDIRKSIQGVIESIHIDRFKEITVDAGNTLHNMYAISIDNLNSTSQNFLDKSNFPAPINTLGGVFIHNKTLYIPAGIFMAFDGVMKKLNKDNPNACQPELISLKHQLKTLEDTCIKQPVQKDDVNIEEERKKSRKERREKLKDKFNEISTLKVENNSLKNENTQLKNKIVVLEVLTASQKAQRAPLPPTVPELYQRITEITYNNESLDEKLDEKFISGALKKIKYVVPEKVVPEKLILSTILEDITLRPYNIPKYNSFVSRFDLETYTFFLQSYNIEKEIVTRCLDTILKKETPNIF